MGVFLANFLAQHQNRLGNRVPHEVVGVCCKRSQDWNQLLADFVVLHRFDYRLNSLSRNRLQLRLKVLQAFYDKLEVVFLKHVFPVAAANLSNLTDPIVAHSPRTVLSQLFADGELVGWGFLKVVFSHRDEGVHCVDPHQVLIILDQLVDDGDDEVFVD